MVRRRQRREPLSVSTTLLDEGPPVGFGSKINPESLDLRKLRGGYAEIRTQCQGVPLEHIWIKSVLRLNGPDPVLLTGMRVEVSSRVPSPLPHQLYFASAGGGEVDRALHVVIEIDDEAPVALVATEFVGPYPRASDLTLAKISPPAITADHPLVIHTLVWARRPSILTTFQLKLDLDVQGRKVSIPCGDAEQSWQVLGGGPEPETTHVWINGGFVQRPTPRSEESRERQERRHAFPPTQPPTDTPKRTVVTRWI